jgi:crotonobetainyl-CoA:carnitine CoA-transferase CaiB-like acyl-CoA transferase
VPSEVLVHPHLTARDRWRTVRTPKGDIQALRPPPVIRGFEQPMGAVPGLGEHTDAVLTEIGYSAEELDALRVDGAIGPAYE